MMDHETDEPGLEIEYYTPAEPGAHELDTTELEDIRSGREAGMLAAGYAARFFQEDGNRTEKLQVRVGEKAADAALVVLVNRGYAIYRAAQTIDRDGRPCVVFEVSYGS